MARHKGNRKCVLTVCNSLVLGNPIRPHTHHFILAKLCECNPTRKPISKVFEIIVKSCSTFSKLFFEMVKKMH